VIIDSHQHFWSIARGDYGWLTPNLCTLYRDFGPPDIEPLLHAQGIDGTVLVQAAPTEAETRHLLKLAESAEFVRGVVGWVDFEGEQAQQRIIDLSEHPKMVGLRPMIQDIKDDRWMLKETLKPAFRTLIEQDLVFDALTLPKHLPYLRQLIAEFPSMSVVIDHGSKPDIASRELKPWSSNMRLIARESRSYVKLSGLVTEASENWTIEDLKPYVHHLLECFGPERIIWGSDWPVCTLASSYERWFDVTTDLLIDLTSTERASVMGGNAINIYKLDTTTS